MLIPEQNRMFSPHCLHNANVRLKLCCVGPYACLENVRSRSLKGVKTPDCWYFSGFHKLETPEGNILYSSVPVCPMGKRK